jgi:hypothetical protein
MQAMNRAYCWLTVVTGVAVLGLASPAVAQTPLLELEKSDGTKVMQVNEDGDLVALGPFNGGPLPATGAGIRLMWWPGGAAFRAGRVSGAHWDAANIGDYSTATGTNTVASGEASAAMGLGTTASGDYSVATGYSTTASGYISTAMGGWTNASSDYSTALGEHTTASADFSTAIGSGTTASGLRATAMGASTTASGHEATAMGRGTTAQAYASLALGQYNVVEGSQTSWVVTDPLLVVGNGTDEADRSNALTLRKNGDLAIAGRLATGFNSTASGASSTAVGYFSTASGGSSTAMGNSTNASGDISTAMGYNTIASGGFSTATGYNTTASGGSSTAMGYNTTASGDYSTAMGSNTNARANYSTAMGFTNGIAETADYSTVMGTYAVASGSGAFVYGDASTTSTVNSPTNNSFTVRAAGGVWFYSNPAMTQGARLVPGAGAWSSISDRALKENFADVDGEALLEGIALLSMQSWNYKAQDPSIRHLGPMAQDFQAAFGLGEDERLINGVDIDGVTLAGVQALERRTRDLQAENQTLKAWIEALQRAIEALREQLAALEDGRTAQR